MTMLERSPAVVFDLKSCEKDQNIIFMENPEVEDGSIQFVIQLIAMNSLCHLAIQQL